MLLVTVYRRLPLAHAIRLPEKTAHPEIDPLNTYACLSKNLPPSHVQQLQTGNMAHGDGTCLHDYGTCGSGLTALHAGNGVCLDSSLEAFSSQHNCS